MVEEDGWTAHGKRKKKTTKETRLSQAGPEPGAGSPRCLNLDPRIWMSSYLEISDFSALLLFLEIKNLNTDMPENPIFKINAK